MNFQQPNLCVFNALRLISILDLSLSTPGINYLKMLFALTTIRSGISTKLIDMGISAFRCI
ncbi:MAG: hypothetical protein HW390_2645 [Candidatus Brocadiaceae bacterium]|nr:hypothetical protein [Candidatus Brocadiaceae bacterium]